MSIATILDRITSKKKAAVLSVADAYLQLVRDIASGSEVDCDDAAETIDAANKNAVDFERDVALMQRRFKMASEVQELRALQKNLPTLENEAQIAKKKLNDAISKLQPLAAQAEVRVHELQTRISQYSMAERQLVETCMDVSLLEREAELIAQRKAVVEKMEPLKYDLRCQQSYLRDAEGSFVAIQQRLKEYKGNHPAAVRYREELARDQKLVETGSITVRDLQEAIDELSAELAELNNELDDIRKAKLTP